MKMLFGTLLLTALFVIQFQECPPQTYKPLPIEIDSERIAVNPSSNPPGQKLLLDVVTVAQGQTVHYENKACDPDGDTFTLTSSLGVITPHVDGTWSLEWTPLAVGATYIDVTATDIRQTGDSLTTTGTLVIITIPANRPVSFCGGKP